MYAFTESNLRALAADVLDDAQLQELTARLHAADPKAAFHGTPSGEGGDLDAIEDEVRESELTRLLRTATGSQLDTRGEKLELPRAVGQGHIESDTDYRGRLLAKSNQLNVGDEEYSELVSAHMIAPPSTDGYGLISKDLATGRGSQLDTLGKRYKKPRASDEPDSTYRARLAEEFKRELEDDDAQAQVPPTLPDGPLFDAEDVTRLLVAFAGMSELRARTVVSLYILPGLTEAAQANADACAQSAHDHAQAAERYQALLTHEVIDASPDVLETFSRMVGES